MTEDLEKIDLDGINSQLSDIKGNYSSISASFSEYAASVESHLSSVKDSLTTINISLSDTYSRVNTLNQLFGTIFTNILKSFDLMNTHVTSISKNLNTINNLFTQGGVSLGPSSSDVTTAGTDTDIEKLMDDKFKAMNDKINKLQELTKKAEDENKKQEDIISKILEREAKSLKGSMSSVMDKVTNGLAGAGFIGGILSLIILGVSESQRLQAQRGEMLNAVEAAGGIFKTGVQKAVGWLSSFAEEAQYYFGISREEIQGYVKELANAGFEINNKLIPVGKSIYDVQANIVTATLALDKHLNLASGSSMKNALDLVKNYGYSLDEASNKIVKLGLAAQRSGSDIQGFINSVMASSSTLYQYGIDLESVGGLLTKLQDFYSKELGPGKSQMAGKLATGSLNTISQNIMNMTPEERAMFARNIPEFSHLEGNFPALNKAVGEMVLNPNQLQGVLIPQYASYARNKAMQAGGGDEAAALLALEKNALNLGGSYNVVQGKALLDLGKNVDTYGIGAVTPQQMNEFLASFKTEGQTLTDLQKLQRDLIRALKDIGEGLLMMMTGVLGVVIVGFKSIIPAVQALAVIMNPLSSTPDKTAAEQALTRIANTYDLETDAIKTGYEKIKGGGGKLGKLFEKVFGMSDPLSVALDADFSFKKSAARGSEEKLAQQRKLLGTPTTLEGAYAQEQLAEEAMLRLRNKDYKNEEEREKLQAFADLANNQDYYQRNQNELVRQAVKAVEDEDEQEDLQDKADRKQRALEHKKGNGKAAGKKKGKKKPAVDKRSIPRNVENTQNRQALVELFGDTV